MTFTERTETHATAAPIRLFPKAVAPDRSPAPAAFAEVRAAKVAQLRSRIATGTYHINAAAIADALIRSALR